MGAVLEQEDPVLGAVGGDSLCLKREVTADVDEDRRAGPVTLSLGDEVVERQAQILAIAVDELDPRARVDRRQRGRHEGVRGTQDRVTRDLREAERRQRAARPARQRDGRQLVPFLPQALEALGHRRLGPALGIEHLVDQRVKPGTVTLIEADGKA